MKAKMIVKKIALSLLIFITVVTVIPMITTPIRRPGPLLRLHVLRITPMGTHIDDVVAAIENRDDWNLGRVDFERGFSPTSTQLSGFPRIGEMSVTANLGSYHAWYIMFGVPDIGVSAQWGFDEGGNLIAVNIRKIWGP